MKTEVKKLENSQVEIKVVLPADTVESFRAEVEKEFIANVQVDGFRKGKVPHDVAMKELSTLRVWEEMSQRAISKSYVDILTSESIKAIGHPQIMITKIAEGSDLEFTVTTAVLPEITIADYKKIAKTENNKEFSADVSNEEFTEAVDNIRRMRAQQEMMKNAQEGDQPVNWNDIKAEDLPEITDDWVKELGKFENVDDFNAKMKENLSKEKEAKNEEKRRLAIIESIIESSDIEVPDMMVEYEIDKMMHEFEGNIAMTGTSFDDYLKSIEKTREDYRKEWSEQGKKRAQTQLMLNHIAATENIEASDESIEAEVAKIMDQYKNQKGIDENNVRAYVASILTHQEVFNFLDAQK